MDRFEPAYRAELEAFVATVRSTAAGQPCSLAEARAAMLVALAADRSRAERRPVAIERDRARLGHRGLRVATEQPDKGDGHMGIEDEMHETTIEETGGLSRRGLLVKGGLLAAGLTAFGAEATAAFAAQARPTKIAVVTHGDTGSFWSVFKNGVDQAAKDLKGRGISVTQVYANNDVVEAGVRHQRRDRREGQRDRDLGAGRERAQGPAHEGVQEGHRDHHGELGPGRVRQPADVRRCTSARTRRSPARARASSSSRPGAKKVVVIIHEASNSGLHAIAPTASRRSTFKGTTKTLTDPERQVRHPRHEGQGQGLLHGQQEHRRASSVSTPT